MATRSLNRREFLRLSYALAGGAFLTACQKEPVTLTPSRTRMSAAGIRLQGRNLEAWLSTKVITGSLKNPAACQSLWIQNNGSRLPAILKENQFSAAMPIHPGDNHLTAVCQHSNQEEELSPENLITGRLPQRPTARITLSLVQQTLVLDGSSSQPDELENRPIRDYRWSARADNPGLAQVQASAGQELQGFRMEVIGSRIELALPPVDGEYYFSLRVIDDAGREDTSSVYVVVENGRPRVPDYDHENPVWVEEAIVYGVIPRLFGTPGARAVQEKLDYLADLGINALWLAPINATVDYGYSVTDYFELRENFGSKEDFHALVQAAHDRDIRVLMDFVPNHTSSQHPYFLDTLEKGQDSPYWDFYDRDEQGNYTYYFDWKHLPNLNYNNPEVRRMMLEAFSYWVREFDVDGFRVDACWGVQERRPDFWPEWRRELKRIKPDLLLLAEASARDQYNFDNGFDAAYDWTDQLGRWAWGSFWADDASKVEPAQTVKLLKAALTNAPEGYHPDALIFRFLNNNDTRTRFITSHGEELTRVATALLLTLPGLPYIYTADEIGQWFLPYDGGLISWSERYQGLRDYHKKLIALRKEIPSLHSRQWQMLELEHAGQVFGYIRYSDVDQQPVIVLLNFGEEPAKLSVSLPEGFPGLAAASALQDRLNDEMVSVKNGKVMIPGYGVRIFNRNRIRNA